MGLPKHSLTDFTYYQDHFAVVNKKQLSVRYLKRDPTQEESSGLALSSVMKVAASSSGKTITAMLLQVEVEADTTEPFRRKEPQLTS